MKRKLSLSLIFLLTFTSILGLLSTSGLSASIDYTFDSTTLFETNNPSNNNTKSHNLRYTPYAFNETYNGTYSFTNDNEGANPQGFTVSEGGGSVNVLDDWVGHNKILLFNDTNAGLTVDAIQLWTEGAQTSGTWEHWINIDDCTPYTYLYGYAGATLSIRNYIVLEEFYAHEPGGGTAIEGILDNRWYHIRIDFECGAGGYQGLGADTYYIYINGVRYGAYDFFNVATEMTRLYWLTSNADTNLVRIDALGYSFNSSYDIGDNILPNMYNVNTSVMEVDKYEFSQEATNDFYEHGDNDFSGWTSSNNDDCFDIIADWSDSDDQVIEIYSYDELTNRYIEHEFSSNLANHNITWSLNASQFDNTGRIKMMVYSTTDDLLTVISVETDLVDIFLKYYDGSYQELRDDLAIDTLYEFNLFINTNDSCALLEYSVNSVVVENYFFPLNYGSDGLGKVRLEVERTETDATICEVDYIGVYSNGVSHSDDFAFYVISPNITLWNFEQTSLFTLIAYGDFSINLNNRTYNVDDDYLDFPTLYYVFDEMFSSDSYTNISTTLDCSNYEYFYATITYIENPEIILYIDGNFSISYISLDSFTLTDGTTHYYPVSTSGNVGSESYFTIDDSNNLDYNITFDDSNTEYIQLEFDIPNLFSDNYTTEFTSYHYGNGYGYFAIDYDDSSNYAFEFPTTFTSRNFYRTNHLYIDKAIILITDNDEITSGSAIGSISSISFHPISDVSFTITTISLLNVLIVVIIMFIPPLIISFRYGKDKLLPMLILMNIVCLATNLIPIWLFIITLIGLIGSLFVRDKEVFN